MKWYNLFLMLLTAAAVLVGRVIYLSLTPPITVISIAISGGAAFFMAMLAVAMLVQFHKDD